MSHRDVETGAERLHERFGLERLRAALAAKRQWQPDDDDVCLVLRDERHHPVEPRLARRSLDDPDGPRERPVASDTATPVRAAP